MSVSETENRILLSRLVLRRQLFRQEDGGANWSDDALLALSELKPTTLDGCRAVPDVTPKQLEKYGAAYVSIIRDHLRRMRAPEKTKVEEETRAILASLEQQLIGISRRNRLLFTGKLRARSGVDFTEIASEKEISSLLFSGGKLVIRQEAKTGRGKTKFDRIADLMREINRTVRETGSMDLYVGYPYVTGRLDADPFVFEAPLLLFPMRATKTGGEMTIAADPSRSVLYNTNLIVAVNRLNGKMGTFEQETLEDGSAYDLKAVLKKYEELGVRISCGSAAFSPYESNEKRPIGPSLSGMCVLGKFSMQGTSLQRDFDRILQWQTLPKSVAELVENVGKEDLEAKLEEVGDAYLDKKIKVREKDLVYINDLNASQERVVAALREKDKLVVAGPPGTGKSQVITSVIADFAMRGKSVLMVTEKKAALDVVRSRLGILNDFCLQIDDAEDKVGFYEQILRMLNKIDTVAPPYDDPYSEAIEADLDRFRAIRDAMYAEHGGVRIADLYRAVDKPDLDDPIVRARWEDVEKFAPFTADYPAFVEAGKRLLDPTRTRLMEKWFDVVTRSAVSNVVRRDLKDTDVEDFVPLARDAQKRLQRAALLKGGKRKKELREIEEILLPRLEETLAARPAKRVYAAVCADLDTLAEIFSDYEGWLSAVAAIEAMSAGERQLNAAVFRLAVRWKCTPRVAYERVERYFVCTMLDEWERSNREILRDVDGYDGIVLRLRETIRKKKECTIERLYGVLGEDFAKVRISKRFGDLRRIAESARRMSVTRFLQRFDNELFLGVKVWLLTPEIASAVLPLREGMFDLVVFDEASQLYVERAIPALVRGKKILIVGDNKQLRPSSLGSGRTVVDEDTLEEEGIESTALEVESLLDLAEAKYDRVMLEAHYRSDSEELIAFSNYAFYKGKLLISPNLAKADRPIEVIRVKNGVWEKRANLSEAERVVKLLKTILSSKGDATVGIITFNSSQRDAIERLIETECAKSKEFNRLIDIETRRKERGEDIGLFVKNIENVQGDERDIIIFSVGYAYDRAGRFSRNFGWLNAAHGENRLNVAITRAKKKIYFVESLSSAEFDVSGISGKGPQLLKQYMAYAEAVSAGDEEAVKRVLKGVGTVSSADVPRSPDPYADVLEREFREKGFETARNVGIGGVVLDLAVTYPNGKTEGYESDTDLYRIDPDTRSRDFHRRNYLESRGWSIHRIWSSQVFERSKRSDRR